MAGDSEQSDRTRLRNAFVAIQKLQSQLQAAENARHEPIAIVGMACRFPGGDTPEAFWDFIASGGDAAREVPPDRWDLDAWSDPDPDAPGKSYSRVGAFIGDVDRFDAALFGIAPREAATLDPQQGLLLETAWEAFEDASLAPDRQQGSATGVFIGLCNSDYARVVLDRGDAALDAYAGTGTSPGVAAGRISYVFGLRGPSLVIDTACSSALVAIHQACQSLRSGECRAALAGGVNLLFDPRTHVVHAKARMLSRSGRCRAFDAGADGFVRGEGCGIVVLRRLSDAVADGNRVLAVIRGTAVNQDGHSSGLTAPNGPSQQEVIRAALAQAGVDPAAVDYVEAHGTGTALGDPIEAEALHAVYGCGRKRENPLWIGSVKTNVGHLEAAAGVAGLIKVILALRHQRLPPHLHLQNPSPHIPWDRMALRVCSDGAEWPRQEHPRVAGISSFGFGGTNAHLVVEEAPRPAVVSSPHREPRFCHVLCLSTAQPAALRSLAGSYAAWLEADPALDPADFAFSANTGRSHLDHRAAVVFASRDELVAKLRQLASGDAPDIRQGRATRQPRIAFLFSGQGSQYPGMARRLYETQPVFREALDQAASALNGHLPRSLLDVIFQPGEALNQTGYTQPALFAVEMALVALWRSWGIEPQVVLGHSVGEFAAACAAGVFDLSDGLRLIAERGRLMQSLPAGGAMAAIPSEAVRVLPFLNAAAGVSLAADNGSQTTISGPAAAVDATLARLRAAGMRGQRLSVSHAFHSVLMEPILDDLTAFAAGIECRQPDKVLIANVTGRPLEAGQSLDAAYWRRHAREPVRFAASVQSLAALECDVLVEVGPAPVLISLAQRAWPAEAEHPAMLASLRQGRAGDELPAEALATLYVRGVTPDWAAWDRPWCRTRQALPTYPFQRVPYVAQAWRPPQPSSARSLDGLLYEVGWQELPPVRDTEPDPAGRWLIVGGAQGLAARLAATRPGCHVVVPPPGAAPADWDRLLAGDPTGPWSGVLYVAGDAEKAWVTEPSPVMTQQASPVMTQKTGHGAILPQTTAEPPRPARTPLGSVPAAAERFAEDALGLIHALIPGAGNIDVGRSPLSSWPALCRPSTPEEQTTLEGVDGRHKAGHDEGAGPRLWLVTAGAQAATEADAIAPEHAALWGLGRAATSELPGLMGGLIDLPPENATAELAGAVWAQLDMPDGENQIALRATQNGTVRYAARLRPRPSAAAKSQSAGIRPDGRYLITGGVGALGLHMADWLADQGARTLVLLSRRAVAEGPAAERVARLRARGVEVRLVAADVSDRSALEAALAGHWPLAGIVHAAGVSALSPLGDMTAESLRTTLAAKVAGTWNLHELTLGRPVGLFLCVSSVAAIWGGRGQAHYAAANAFLDGLVQHRWRLGLAGLSIDYGPWQGAGMVTGEARDWLERTGLRPMQPGVALSGLAGLLAAGASQAVMVDADWPRFLAVYQARRPSPLLSEIAAALPAAVAPASEAVEKIPLEGRQAWIDGLVERTLAEVLRISPDTLDPLSGFFDLGMDSLTAVEFALTLARRLGRSLPTTLAMDHPNRAALADYLIRTLFLGGGAPAEHGSVATSADEPIAIVGLACRFPGANDPDAYWRLLSDGVDAIREVPPERWDIAAWYDPAPTAAGKMYTRHGGFLDQIDQFDAALFRITPREAMGLDPQQRVLLETAWEALHNAGQSPDALRGSRGGVYVGVGANEYGQLTATGGPEALDAYFGTGNALNVIAGRCAYVLGLHGPAVTLDTACSSSLVAVHQAVLGLRSGDCDLALAGGVNLMISPLGTVAACRAHMLAPDGHCKTFDAAADGYVRGEGCGVVVLKRLSDAQHDGDRVLAVVRGSAVNHDGASSGLTVPNGPAQEALLRLALVRAGVDAAEVAYVEAHGTGTALGDPIEVQALGAVFAEGRPDGKPLWVGSAKSQIGHLEAAAGIAGLIKVVLAMHHRRLPGQVHFHTPNPHVAWDALPVRVVERGMVWPEGRRVAGVSSFGFSGTNAHVVLEAGPDDGEPGPIAPASPYLFRRQRYWIDPLPVRSAALAPLLGACQVSALSGEAVHEARWGATTHPFIAEHRVYGEMLVPGATYAAMALSVSGLPGRVLDLEFHEPMVFRSDETRVVQLVVSAPDEDGGAEFQLFSAVEARTEAEQAPPPLWGGGGGAGFCGAAVRGSTWPRPPSPSPEGRGGSSARAPVANPWTRHARGRLMPLPATSPREAVSVPELQAAMQPAPAESVFAGLAAVGVDLGPRFRSIQAIWRGADEALGRLVPPPDLSKLASNLVLHPALLDACTQVVGAARVPSEAVLFVPWRYDRLELYAPLPAAFYCHARLRPDIGEAGESATADLWFLDEAGQLLGQLNGFVLKRAPRELLLRGQRALVDDLFYQLQWDEAPLPTPAFPDDPALPGAITHVDLASVLPAEPLWSRYQGLVQGLEPVAFAWIVRCFQQLGWQPIPGDRIQAPALARRLRIEPRHDRLVRRLLQLLAEGGFLDADADGWVVRRPVSAPEPASVRRDLEHRFRTGGSSGAPELDLLDRCGEHLPAVLRGEMDPLGILFPEHGRGGAEAVYRDGIGAQVLGRLVRQVVAAAVARLPQGRPLRVLEVGAGTGGTTAHVLDALPAGSSYCYTDISPAFFPASRTRFAAWPFVTYRTLDIEHDPLEQGLLPQAFDLVVAANVLHATSDLDQTLSHVGSLVAPGGLCLLLEGVQRRAWLDLTFGLLPGWWRFEDARRTDYPLLSREAWSAALAAHGLTDVAVASAAGDDAEQVVMVARRDAAACTAASGDADGWLIFADTGGVTEKLAARLAGTACVTVTPGPAFEQTAPGCYTLPQSDRDAWARLLSEIAKRGMVLRHVVYLWGLDAGGTRGDPATLPDQVQAACGDLLAVVQALAGNVTPSFGGFSIITRGAQPTGEEPAIAQAALLGLGLGIATEHPELRCRRIDLDPACPDDQADQLWAELHATDEEDQVAWRGSLRHVARLARIAPASRHAGTAAFNPSACYLITGGLGGLGLEVARWMAERGARHLVLLGRTEPDPAAAAAVQALRNQGSDVRIMQADVSDERQVLRVLEEIRGSPPPLRGVVHAAGQLHDAALLHQTTGSFAEVLAAKVAGAWNLHRLTEHDGLEAFVLFSSTASVLGSWGQANHAAANSFLDALAHYRRARGLPAISIDWGPWAEIGAAARRGVETRMAGHGVEALAPAQGIAALERCLTDSPVQAAVVRIDWPRLRDDLRHREPPRLLRTLLDEVRDLRPATPTDRGDLLRRLQALAPAEAAPVLVERIQQEVAQVLRLGRDAWPDPNRGWFDLGMDSLVLVELHHWLQGEFGDACRLPPTLAFELTTISALAHHVVGEVCQRGDLSEAQPPAVADDTDDLSALSLDELVAQLDEQIADATAQTWGAP